MSDQSKATPSGQRTLAELSPDNPGGLPEWALKLTPRKLAFVQEYLVDFNGRAAALRASISKTDGGAASVSKTLLRDPDVMEAIAVAMADTVKARQLLRQRIIEELSAIAFYDVNDHVVVRSNTVILTDTDDLTEDQRRAVKRYKQTTGEKSESLEVEFHDKVKALDLLDRINGGGKKGGDFNVNVNSEDNRVLVMTPEQASAAAIRPPGPRPKDA